MAIDQENREIPGQGRTLAEEQEKTRRDSLTKTEEFLRYQEQRASGSKTQVESGTVLSDSQSAKELLAKERPEASLDEDPKVLGMIKKLRETPEKDRPKLLMTWINDSYAGKLTPHEISRVREETSDLDIAA